MALTLLQLVNRVESQLGLTQSQSVISSSVQQSVQMLALANGMLLELVSMYEWQRLVTPYYFTTSAPVGALCNSTGGSNTLTGFSSTAGLAVGMVASGPTIPVYAEIQSIGANSVVISYPATTATASASCNFYTQKYALPADFDRMISDTNWDRSNHWPNLGPKSSQEMQWLQGGLISTVPRERFRVIGNSMVFFPAPTSALNMVYEYVSNYTVLATGGTSPTKSSFTVDTDTCVFRDELMTKGLKYHWRKAKRLDFAAELVEFNDALSRAQAQDEPAPRMSLTPLSPDIYILPSSIPEGSWPIN